MRPGRLMRPGLGGGIFLVLALVLPGSLPGAGLRDFQDSWLISSEVARAVLGSPLPAGRQLVAEAGQCRLFSLPELEQKFLGAAIRGKVMGRQLTLKGSWETLGGSLYRETRLVGNLAWGLGPGLGCRLVNTRTAIEGEQISSDLGLSLNLGHRMAWGESCHLRFGLLVPLVTSENLVRHDSRVQLANLTLILPGAALGIQVDRRFDGSPVLGFDFLWGRQAGWAINLRIDPTTGAVGPGLLLQRGFVLLRTSHLLHPELGQTHRFSLILGGGHE